MVGYDMVPPSAGVPPFDAGKTYFDSRFSLGFGYRWRLKPIDSRWFFDLAITAGYHRYKYGLSYLSPDEHITYAGNAGVCNLLSVSLSGSAGYYLYKGLNLSVGVESAYYFYDKNFVNVPVFVRLGYDFGCMEIAIQYKRGMTRKFDLFPFVNNRLSGWALMVYIPLSKRNTN